MLVYTARRGTWAIVLCLILSLITFVIFYIVPRQTIVDPHDPRYDARTAQLAKGSMPSQYAHWLRGVVGGSLGRSTATRRPVSSILRQAAPVTIALTIGGALVWLMIALPLGVFSAVRPRSKLDHTATVVVLAGMSAHPLWLGLILSYLVGFQLHLLPISGYCNLYGGSGSCSGLTQWFTHMVMPWFTFALVFAALYVRMIRANVTEALSEDYVRLARAKGMSEWRVLRRHVLPNALISVVPMVAMDISRVALPTALFVETAFGLPGLGRALRDALVRDDLPVVVGVVIVSSIVIVIANLIGDLLQVLIDPRVKLRTEVAPL